MQASSKQGHNDQKIFSQQGFGLVGIAVALILIAGLGTAIYFLFFREPAQEETNETAQDIRDAFIAPPGTFTPPPPTTYNPPTTTPETTAPETTPPPVIAGPNPEISPRGPAANRSAPPPAPAIYSNPALGFAFKAPANWAISAGSHPGTTVVFVDKITGATAGFIEVYENPGETLESLADIFQGSPSVTSVSPAAAGGQAAVRFQSGGSGSGGIATIHNDKIYYLRGALALPEYLDNFSFIR